MRLFLVVETIVGAFTAYFFDVDTALRVGKHLVEYWIIAGLVLTFLEPVVEIFYFVRFVFRKVYHVLYRFTT